LHSNYTHQITPELRIDKTLSTRIGRHISALLTINKRVIVCKYYHSSI
jgi:hypothetical protein